MRRPLPTFLLGLAICLLLPALLSACPLCKDAMDGTTGGSAGLGRGFYWSILLMIAAPWTAVGTVAYMIWKKRRRAGPSRAVGA